LLGKTFNPNAKEPHPFGGQICFLNSASRRPECPPFTSITTARTFPTAPHPTAACPPALTRYPCSTRETLIATIGALWGGTTTFYKIAVDTHGNKGMIFFNHQPIDAGWWNRSAVVAPRAPSLSMPPAA
jgi:hypothetical protein